MTQASPQAPDSPKSSNALRMLGFLAIIVIAAGVMYYLGQNYLNKSESSAVPPPDRVFIDAETNKPFTYQVKINETIPVSSPFSGKKTGYPAEMCYWTADGKIKETPTPVLLNETVGKEGPTFCPDCGRLVVGHNPRPAEGSTPPPTKEEYAAQQAATTGPAAATQSTSNSRSER